MHLSSRPDLVKRGKSESRGKGRRKIEVSSRVHNESLNFIEQKGMIVRRGEENVVDLWGGGGGGEGAMMEEISRSVS